MKYLFSALIIFFSAYTASAQNCYLLPQSFFIAKGEKATIDILMGRSFDASKDRKYETSQLTSASLHGAGKPVDLLADSAASKTSFTMELPGSGLSLFCIEKKDLEVELEREELIMQLLDDGYSDLAEKVEEKELLKVHNVLAAKALVMNEKTSGKAYEETTGQQLEIVLFQNPYKMKYGEDVIAQVLFKGEPLAKKAARITVKTLNGSLVNSDHTTDDEGKFNFKLNRSGSWMLGVLHIVPDEESGDFGRWYSSYSFGFK